ncbi:MAG: UTP--glucose-1-phosphate uridylyltransferase [Candidatus Omnitrophica bacterium]|nr:UTP--glucose-1-phosphate uridylyltransferase [Candidatus Omnitrophota bacterium]
MIAQTSKFSLFHKTISVLILLTFTATSIVPTPARAQLNLTAPGVMVMPSAGYNPAIVRGITVDPKNPLQFDFLVDRGQDKMQGETFKTESLKLVKYFLASLTVPEKELWVNLSPYEKDRMIPNQFGQTEMGRDLLAQDYMLKQLTSSLMFPEKSLGAEFWQRVYAKAKKQFGTTDIPLNTFNKVWIVPSKAVVYEHDNTAYILESHLKVMLEEDYVALQKNSGETKFGMENLVAKDTKIVSGVTSQIVKEIIIPEIEKEVNTGKTFANLRQIYNSNILATWFKRSLKESLLGQIYADKNKTKGINNNTPETNQKIYNQYLEAFKTGVFNYIKEDYDPAEQKVIAHKYFSGGNSFAETDAVTTIVHRTNRNTLPGAEIANVKIDLQKPGTEAAMLPDGAQLSLGDGKKVNIPKNRINALRDTMYALRAYGMLYDPEGYGYITMEQDGPNRAPRYGTPMEDGIEKIETFTHRHLGENPDAFEDEVVTATIGIGGQSTCVAQAKGLINKHPNRQLIVLDSLGTNYKKLENTWVNMLRRNPNAKLLWIAGSKSGKTDETMANFQDTLRTMIRVWARIMHNDELGNLMASAIIKKLWNVESFEELANLTMKKLTLSSDEEAVLRQVFKNALFITGKFNEEKQSGSLLDRMIKQGFLGELFKSEPENGVIAIEMLNNLGGRYQGLSPHSLAINSLLGLDIRAMLEAGRKVAEEQRKNSSNQEYVTQKLAEELVAAGISQMVVGAPNNDFKNLAEALGQTVPESLGKGREYGIPMGIQTYAAYGTNQINKKLNFVKNRKFMFIIDVKGQPKTELSPEIEANNIVFRYEMDGINEVELAKIIQFVEDLTVRIGTIYTAHALSLAQENGIGTDINLTQHDIIRQIMQGADNDNPEKEAITALHKIFDDITPFRQPGVEMAKELVAGKPEKGIPSAGDLMFNSENKKDASNRPIRDAKQRDAWYQERLNKIADGPAIDTELTALRDADGNFLQDYDAIKHLDKLVKQLEADNPFVANLNKNIKYYMAIIRDGHARGKAVNFTIYEDRNPETEKLKEALEKLGADRVDFGPAEQHKSRQLTVRGEHNDIEIIIQSVRTKTAADQENSLVADGTVAKYIHNLKPSEVRSEYATQYGKVFMRNDVQTETATFYFADLTEQVNRLDALRFFTTIFDTRLTDVTMDNSTGDKAMIALPEIYQNYFEDLSIQNWRSPHGKTLEEILDAIIKEYDIRGYDGGDDINFPTQMDPELLKWIGRALASAVFKSDAHGKSVKLEAGDTFVIAGDNGPRTPAVRAALIEGLRETGVNVIDLDITTSGELYSSISKLGAQGGLYVTRSHVEIGTNGAKPNIGGITLYGTMLQELKPLIINGRYRKAETPGKLDTSDETKKKAHDAYYESMRKQFGGLAKKLGKTKVSVNLSGGSATGYKDLFQELLGNNLVDILRGESDPFNTTGGLADPSRTDDVALAHPQANIMQYSKDHPEILVLNFDLDTDRISILENGVLYKGDTEFYPIIEDMLTQDPYKEIINNIYFDSRMNSAFRQLVENLGGIAKLSPKGHSIVKMIMDVTIAKLAKKEGKTVPEFLAAHPGIKFAQAEYSLHMFLTNELGEPFDDAVRFGFHWLDVFSRIKEKLGQPEMTLAGYIQNLKDRKLITESYQLQESRTPMVEEAKKPLMIEMRDQVIEFLKSHPTLSDQFEYVDNWENFKGVRNSKPYVMVNANGVFHIFTPFGEIFWGWSNTSPKIAFGVQSNSPINLEKLTEIAVTLLGRSRTIISERLNNLALPTVNPKETSQLMTMFSVTNGEELDAKILPKYPTITDALTAMTQLKVGDQTDAAALSEVIRDSAITSDQAALSDEEDSTPDAAQLTESAKPATKEITVLGNVVQASFNDRTQTWKIVSKSLRNLSLPLPATASDSELAAEIENRLTADRALLAESAKPGIKELTVLGQKVEASFSARTQTWKTKSNSLQNLSLPLPYTASDSELAEAIETRLTADHAILSDAEKKYATEIARRYYAGDLQTSPINKPFKLSTQDDVQYVGDISPEEALRLQSIAIKSLLNGEGFISMLVAGASTRMNTHEAPEKIKELNDGKEIESKAGIPIGIVDGKAVTYLDAFGINLQRLFEQIRSAAQKRGLKVTGLDQNIIGLMSNENYIAEQQAIIQEHNNYGFPQEQVDIFLQPLAPGFLGTTADVETLRSKFSDADYQLALKKSMDAERAYKEGRYEDLLMPNERQPQGHGEFFHQLLISGELLRIIKTGKKWVFAKNVDNYAAKFDSIFLTILGKFLDEQLDFQGEVTPRAPAQKGGVVIIMEDGTQQLSEEPNVKASGKNSLEAFWLNSAVALMSIPYILSIYQLPGQTEQEFIKELETASQSDLENIANRGRLKFPTLIDPKPATNEPAVIRKGETNMWQSTGVRRDGIATHPLKTKMIGVDGARNFKIRDYKNMSSEQKRKERAKLRFLGTKSWDKTPQELTAAHKALSEALGRKATDEELALTLETFKGNSILSDAILDDILHGSLIDETAMDQIDKAALTEPTKRSTGGIDLDSAMMNLEIKRDNNGKPLPAFQQPIFNMNIEGFVPVIINITPVTDLPKLLGMADTTNDDSEKYGQLPMDNMNKQS